MASMTRNETPVTGWRQHFWRKFGRFWPLYLMLLPGLIYFAIFRYGPMYGVLIAFKDFNIFDGILGSPWVGLKHFEALFTGPFLVRILRNTLVISFLKLVLGVPPAILLALMLNELRHAKLKRIVQTATYLPHFLSWVIIYGILLALLSPGEGLINQWIREAGGQPIKFFGENTAFIATVVFSNLWKDVGWGAIVYLAALGGINPELYEVSRVDGASRLQQIWHISLPGITSVIVLMLILSLGNIMEAGFEQIYVMQNAQVNEVADIIDTWVFRNGIEQFRFSIAAAAGLFKSVVGLVLVIASDQAAKRLTGSGIW